VANLPSVPSVPGNVEPQLSNFLNAVKTNIDAQQLTSSSSFVTQEQLATALANLATQAQVAAALATAPVSTVITVTPPPNLTPPIALDNLVVTGGVLFNLLTWGDLPGNVDHIAIYRAATDDRTIATIVGTTQYTVWGDYIPSGVGIAYYYWIRAVSDTGVYGEWNLVNGEVSTAGTSATPLGIGDSQVGSISASKIVALTLSAISANLGTVTAGRMASGDGMFVVDLTNKYITIGNGAANPGSIDPWYGTQYISISSGQITNWEWNGSGYVDSKSLRVIEVGTAENGTTVTLSKYYQTQPIISVMPNSLQTYHAANANVDQTLQVSASNIVETVVGSGTWKFTATANLVMAAGSFTAAPNQITGSSSASPLQSATYTTPANTSKLTVNVGLTSVRGTGIAPSYYYRQVLYHVMARISGSGSAFVTVAQKTVNLGSTLTTVNNSLIATFGSTNSWEFFVRAYYGDGGGTFNSGTGGYIYAADVYLQLAANTALGDTGAVTSPSTSSVSFVLPAFTPTPGYTVYNVNHSVSYGYYLFSSGFNSSAQVSSPQGGFYANTPNSGGVIGTGGVPTSMGSYGFTQPSYIQTWTGLNLSADGMVGPPSGGTEYGQAQGRIFAAGTGATIQQRKPITNVTTASNTLKLSSYNATITGATTLATGTLNYLAIL